MDIPFFGMIHFFTIHALIGALVLTVGAGLSWLMSRWVLGPDESRR